MLRNHAHHGPDPCGELGKWFLVLVLVFAAVGLGPCTATAHTKAGVGDHFRKPFVSRLEVFEPLRRHDPDALRITELPAYTSAAWTVELYPDPKRPRYATGHIALFDDRYGDKAGWLWLNLRLSDYDDLAARVDDAVAESRLPPAKGGELIVCTDGPTYVIERRKNGVTTWFEESCPDDAVADDVVEQLVDKLAFPLCWYITLNNPSNGAALDACQKVGPPGVHHEDIDARPADAKPTP